MNRLELLAAWRAGDITVKPDDALDALKGVSRASFYRLLAEGAVPGGVTLGHRRFINLGPFLEFLGVPREMLWPPARRTDGVNICEDDAAGSESARESRDEEFTPPCPAT